MGPVFYVSNGISYQPDSKDFRNGLKKLKDEAKALCGDAVICMKCNITCDSDTHYYTVVMYGTAVKFKK